jgi:hypothetical protein
MSGERKSKHSSVSEIPATSKPETSRATRGNREQILPKLKGHLLSNGEGIWYHRNFSNMLLILSYVLYMWIQLTRLFCIEEGNRKEFVCGDVAIRELKSKVISVTLHSCSEALVNSTISSSHKLSNDVSSTVKVIYQDYDEGWMDECTNKRRGNIFIPFKGQKHLFFVASSIR